MKSWRPKARWVHCTIILKFQRINTNVSQIILLNRIRKKVSKLFFEIQYYPTIKPKITQQTMKKQTNLSKEYTCKTSHQNAHIWRSLYCIKKIIHSVKLNLFYWCRDCLTSIHKSVNATYNINRLKHRNHKITSTELEKSLKHQACLLDKGHEIVQDKETV